MKTRRQTLALGAAFLGLFAAGCAGGPGPEQMSMADNGAQLWQHTCTHCHNLRPAPEYSADKWPIIVSHMRTRADLSKSQAEAIANYLSRLSAQANSD